MSKRTFRIAVMVLGGLVVLGATVDAATGHAAGLSRLGCVVCWAHSLIH
jgi:hypothetical protein